MGVRSFLKKFLKRLLGEEFYGELRDSWNEGYQSAMADPEQPAAVAEEKAPPQAISTEPKKQWQPPAEWQQSKTRAESTTEAPPSPPRPPAPYRYVKEDAPKPSEQVAEAKDAPEVEMVPEDDPQGKLRVIQGNECNIPQEVGAYCWSGIKSL